MRATRRYWSALTLGGFLAGFAAVIARPALLAAAAALGAWLLAAQYLFVRRTRRALADLRIEQWSARSRVVEGDPVTVSLDVELSRPSRLSLRAELNPPASATGISADARRCRIEPGERRASATADAVGSVAGRLRFVPPSLTLTDPLGLFEETVDRGEPLAVDVEPRAPRRLHVGAGGDADVAAYGDHDSAVRGVGIEPIELRQYVYGDDLSRIDWKATARLNQPHIREHEVDTARRTVLLVDHRAAMARGRAGERKLDYAREVALAFVNSARTHTDPLALFAVGDAGLTAERELSTRGDHYVELRERLYDLEPTPPTAESGTITTARPARAGRVADLFDSGATPMERTLRPYFDSRRSYVRRLESRPLFSAVRLHVANRPGAVWTVLFTDDTDRAEVREAVKLARLGGRHVMVFLTPTVLFDEDALVDLESAYRRYREFERFRRGLAGIERVAAFEVGPGDRLGAVLEAGRAERRERSGGSDSTGRPRGRTGGDAAGGRPGTDRTGARTGDRGVRRRG